MKAGHLVLLAWFPACLACLGACTTTPQPQGQSQAAQEDRRAAHRAHTEERGEDREDDAGDKDRDGR